MDAVGRLGGILTAPFHPFGGAVDIVVVEQKNGSFKSSPWYVRFGKFQGVLRAKENVVDVSVNGERANFHMYLDHRGHAYFLREVDVEGNMLSPKSPIEAMDERDRRPVKANSWNYGDSVKQIEISNGKVLARSGSRRARLMGLVFGRKSMKEDKNQEDNGRRDSFERAEFAANLLDMNWSTNLGRVRKERSNASSKSDAGNVETGAFKCLSTVHCETLDPLEIEMDDFGESVDLKCDEVSVQEETSPNLESTAEASSEVETRQLHGTFGDGSELTSTFLEHATLCGSLKVGSGFPTEAFNSSSSVGLDEGKLLCSDLNDATRGEITCAELISLDYMDKENCFSLVSKDIKSANGSFNTDFENLSSNEAQERSNQVNILRSNKEVPDHKVGGAVRSLPITIKSQFDESSEHFLRRPLRHSLVSNLKSSKWALLRESVSGFIKSDAKSVEQLSSSQSITVDDLNFEVLKNIDDAPMNEKILRVDSPKLVKTSGGSWTGRPFTSKRSRSMKDTQLGLTCTSVDTEISLEDTMGMDLQNEVSSPKLTKKNIRVTCPTTEQLASLNLKEGCNIVTFTFSTPMLGKQQVGARVYLWRWDTRVVITDVDGTITKSDVLGQFMPLFGRDWSQTGVAHLFSAIKENGYQLLFLSARAISQAGLTRQFLFNLKQDGKGLPDGPVVISPDGIFPSLFREIIRKAPHEFKIACLEDIKACFPSDRNPFYAGFGNRGTDEFSYLKVGIPIGKIFIINPKGEVVVNRCDNKSYASLHALVNGMFPPMSSEQEDFNSWNFWKLPPRVINV